MSISKGEELYSSTEQQTIRVAKNGGDHRTVQAAYDAITDATSTKRYTILVSPGRYNEQIVPKQYVSLVGNGALGDIEIYNALKVLDITTQLETNYQNIYFKCEATTDSQDVIEIDAGTHRFTNCKLEWVSSTASIRGRILDGNGGSILLDDCFFIYDYNNATAGISNHIAFDLNATTFLEMHGCEMLINTIDDQTVRAIDDSSVSGGEFIVSDTRIEIVINHPTYSDNVFIYRQSSSSTLRRIHNCQLHAHNVGGGGGGVGRAIWIDSGGNSGVIESVSNDIVVDGFGTNYAFDVDTTDTASSHFDTIVAADGDLKTGVPQGTLPRVNSPSKGTLAFSGAQIKNYDSITATSEGVAASLLTSATFVTTNGDTDLDDVTLADGEDGQVKTIVCVVKGNVADTWKITPANMIGGTQITFSNEGEGCILMFYNGTGWAVVANNGGVIS